MPSCVEIDKIVPVLGGKIKFAFADEAKEKSDELKEYLGAIKKIFDEVKTHGYGKGHGGAGQIKCPKCDGLMWFTVASINGHIWVRCTNPDCISFIQ